MKVILQQDVKSLGRKGAMVEVAEGYGRNYLIPRGLAVAATDSNMRVREHAQDVERRRQQREKDEAQAISDKIADQTVKIKANAGEGGRLFGSITASDIVKVLADKFGVQIDKRKLELAEPIKALGQHEVTIKLYPGLSTKVKVEVQTDN